LGFKESIMLQVFGGEPDERQYYNSIAIRGPESSLIYQFIDGRELLVEAFKKNNHRFNL